MIRRLTLWLGCLLYELGVRLLNWSWRRDERNYRPTPSTRRPPAVRPTLELVETPTKPWVPKRPSNSWRWN